VESGIETTLPQANRKNSNFTDLFTEYYPHPCQTDIHNSTARNRVVVCGRRFGKTLAAAKEAFDLSLEEGKRIWVVAPYKDLTNKVFRELYYTYTKCMPKGTVTRASQRERFIYLANGTEIEAKTAENEESLAGEGLDFIVFDEAAKSKKDVWDKYLKPALADREGRSLFITTPEGYNWIYYLWKKGRMKIADDEAGDWESFRFSSWDNPYLSREYLKSCERDMTPEMYAQEILAEFKFRSGRVYPEFTDSTHVRSLRVEPGIPIDKCIDFGFTRPFVCLWVQKVPAPNGYMRLNVIDEYYLEGQPTSVHAVHIRNRDLIWESQGARIGTCIVDCENPGMAAELKVCGIPNTSRKTDISQGIEVTRRLLRREDPDGLRGLNVHYRCINFIEEMKLYAYPKPKVTQDGRIISGIKEKPMQADDHGPDALRYYIMYFEGVWNTLSKPSLRTSKVPRTSKTAVSGY